MKKILTLFSLILFLLGIAQFAMAQVENFTTPGEGTWVCPPGVTSVTVECWGGGGAGGGGSHGGAVVRGGGGAGGGYVKSTITVSPGQSYNFKVGAGGIGVVPAIDNETAPSGENTWFIDASTVNAPGGQGGKGRISVAASTLSGAGGIYIGTSAVGTVKHNGGNGGTATGSMSGSGGSSGGIASNGTNGGSVNTQSTVEGGGFGAAGRNNASNGINGGAPGGGGGGARANAIGGTITTNQQTGGNGGDGQIIISYLGNNQTVVTIDWANNSKPDVNYKRGTAAPGVGGFFDDAKTREYLDYQSFIGMGIFNGIRNLFKDPLTNEFYFENGEYKNQQIAKFTDIRKYAHAKGIEMISQVGGTPTNSNYEFDSTYYKQPWGNTSDTDFAPLPKEGTSMQEFQRNFAEWAINADKAVATDFHSIWIGTQEIAHTIGFPGGMINETEENKKLNIRRFTNYWKPISDALRAAGAKTGGLQLNSSNANLYNYSVDYMIQQNLHLDYLTFQFYQWGDTADLVAAVNATKRYSQAYPGTKLIIDRGGHSKLLPEGVSGDADARGVIYFLVGELGAMNYADWVYAYTPDRQINGMDKDKNTLLWLTKAWINTIGTKRCNLTGLPSGVDGFVTRNDKKLSAVIWNRGSVARSINFKINNVNFGVDTQITVKQASGSSFVNSTASWDASTNTITGITLNSFDYVLIDLEGAVTGLDKPTANKLNVYPNPVKDKLYISELNEKSSVEIYNLQGNVIVQKNEIIQAQSIDVSGFEKGVYILRIINNDMVKTTSFIKQ